MKLLRVRQGTWTVAAVADDSGNCQVLEYLLDYKGTDDGEEMLALLGLIAEQGPPHNKQKCRLLKSLSPHIGEVKAGLIRIFFFYDKGKMVVCTHASKKPKDRVLRHHVNRAERIREEYFRAKEEGSLKFKKKEE